MAHTIALIPGDGIGPEITDATVRVLDATGVGFEWEKHEGGIRAFERTGNPLPEELLESIRRNGLALKGHSLRWLERASPAPTWLSEKDSTSTRTCDPFGACPE